MTIFKGPTQANQIRVFSGDDGKEMIVTDMRKMTEMERIGAKSKKS